MSTLRFPYDLPSEAALVELVRRDRPLDDVQPGFVSFGDLFFSPTPAEPGRTYVEMDNHRTGKKNWFVYRRLDIDTVLREYLPLDQYYVGIDLGGKEITAYNIVEEINRVFRLNLDHTDTDMSRTVLTRRPEYIYTLTMHPTGFAYYGQAVVYVNTTPPALEARLTEEGVLRLTQHGIARVAE